MEIECDPKCLLKDCLEKWLNCLRFSLYFISTAESVWTEKKMRKHIAHLLEVTILQRRKCVQRHNNTNWMGTNGNRRSPLDSRKNAYAVQVSKHWHNTPREAVESLSSEIFKSHLDAVLGNLLWVGLNSLQGSLPTSAILWQ